MTRSAGYVAAVVVVLAALVVLSLLAGVPWVSVPASGQW